jgi:hypothetical protein
MKNVAFALAATALLITSAVASTRHSGPSTNQVYDAEAYSPTHQNRDKLLRIYPDVLVGKHFNPVCDMYMTDREQRRSDEKNGSRC